MKEAGVNSRLFIMEKTVKKELDDITN